MIDNKYVSFLLLLLAESIERFSYFFVSFVILYYMMTKGENGGLQFSQENTMKIGGYFSFAVLFFPLILSPFIDKYFGYIKATIYGGIFLILGYFLALISSYFSVYLIIFSLIFCVIGTSLIKPSMSVLVGKLTNSSVLFQDLGYILFVLSVNVASLSSAYFSAKLINQYASFKPFFIISLLLMILFTFLMIHMKKIKLVDNSSLQNEDKKKKAKILSAALLICLFIGISTTVSAKIFSFPNTFSFWFSSLFGIIIILFVVIKFLKQKKKFLYLGMTSLFFIVFLSVNLFARELGSMSAFLPGVFSSFDMLQNFFIFPIMLSFIARYAPQRAQAVYQAIAFFLFSLSTIMVKNTLPLITLSGSYLILFLSILIILIVAGFFRVVYKNYK